MVDFNTFTLEELKELETCSKEYALFKLKTRIITELFPTSDCIAACNTLEQLENYKGVQDGLNRVLALVDDEIAEIKKGE